MLEVFKKLPKFAAGEALKADQLNIIVESIIALANGENISTSGTILKGFSDGQIHLKGRRSLPGPPGAPAEDHPWKVTISTDGSESTDPETLDEELTNISIVPGRVYDSILGVTELDVADNATDNEALGGDTIALVYTYATEAVSIEIVSPGGAGEYEPYVDDGGDPPDVTIGRYPLAKIITDPDTGALSVEQMALNHMALAVCCVDGVGVTSFTPI